MNKFAAEASDQYEHASIVGQANEERVGEKENPITIESDEVIVANSYAKVLLDCAMLDREITLLQSQVEAKKVLLEDARKGLYHIFSFYSV